MGASCSTRTKVIPNFYRPTWKPGRLRICAPRPSRVIILLQVNQSANQALHQVDNTFNVACFLAESVTPNGVDRPCSRTYPCRVLTDHLATYLYQSTMGNRTLRSSCGLQNFLRSRTPVISQIYTHRQQVYTRHPHPHSRCLASLHLASCRFSDVPCRRLAPPRKRSG